MELKKKLLVASLAAIFVSVPVYANTIDAQEQANLIDELLDDALDLDDAQVRVISAAINLAPLDASVSITGAAIEFNAASSATATANAVIDSNLSDANATITSIASANSGNAIKTNAIGAVNDSTVDIQPSC